mgnify:CR=1 FL=1
MRTRNRPLEESFLARVDMASNDECWLWNGAKNAKGYGKFWHSGKSILATHVSLFITTGKWPTYVMHLCDNPICVNPIHLRQSTHLENMQDMAKKNRNRNQYKNRTHCSAGHEYKDGTFFVYIKRGKSYRHCRECHNAPRRKK